MVITKGKPLEDDPVVVQLLSGSRVEFQSIGKVKASMVVENQPTTKAAAGTKTIETDVSPLLLFPSPHHLPLFNRLVSTPSVTCF